MHMSDLEPWVGHAGNLTNPVTRGYSLVYVNVILLFVALILFSLRMYTRAFISRSLGWDDLAMTLGVMFTIGLSLDVVLANLQYYWGRHMWDIPLTYQAIGQVMKTQMAAKVLFSTASFFTRIALLLFYYRLIVDTGLKWFKRALYAAFAFDFAVFVAFVVLSLFACTPVQGYWTPGVGICLNEGTTMVANGIVHTVADAMTTALPIPMIMKLRMPKGQKIGVLCLLGLGFIVTIAGIIRTYYIYYSNFCTTDTTWYAYPLWIAAAIQVQLAVITACIPPIRPLFAYYFGDRQKLPKTKIGRPRSPPRQSMKLQKKYPYNKSISSKSATSLVPDGDSFMNFPPLKRPRSAWQIITRQSVEVRTDAIPRDLEGQITWKKQSWEHNPPSYTSKLEKDIAEDDCESLYPTEGYPPYAQQSRTRSRTNSSGLSRGSSMKKVMSFRSWFRTPSPEQHAQAVYNDGPISNRNIIIMPPYSARHPSPYRDTSTQTPHGGLISPPPILPYPALASPLTPFPTLMDALDNFPTAVSFESDWPLPLNTVRPLTLPAKLPKAKSQSVQRTLTSTTFMPQRPAESVYSNRSSRYYAENQPDSPSSIRTFERDQLAKLDKFVITKNPFVHVDKSRLKPRMERSLSRATTVTYDGN